jgi:hypothetical protein
MLLAVAAAVAGLLMLLQVCASGEAVCGTNCCAHRAAFDQAV